jgi:hypothetical protein
MGLLVWLGLRRASKWERPRVLDMVFASPLDGLVHMIYHIFLLLRGRPFEPGRRAIKVVCISDTHDQMVKVVPDGDLLIHCGDLTNRGDRRSIQTQVNWLAKLPHRHKVVIAGNHDNYLDAIARREENDSSLVPIEWQGIHYLDQRMVTLDFFQGERHLNVFGAPKVPTLEPQEFYDT